MTTGHDPDCNTVGCCKDTPFIARLKQRLQAERPRAKAEATRRINKRISMVVADYARMDNPDTIPVDKIATGKEN